MEIHKLPAGELAPQESDCIRIIRNRDGRYSLNCNALESCGEGDEAESVSLIGGGDYATYDQAESAGLAWANDHCASVVYISTVDPDDVTD